MTDKPRLEPRDVSVGRVAARQHGLITSRQLAALGLSRQAISSRVTAGRLYRVQRGVYAVGHRALTVDGNRLAAVLTFGEGAVASHITAAAIWGIRQTSAARQHVSVAGDSRSRPGLRVYRRPLASTDREIRRGIPVTSLARTLVDLGDLVPPSQVRNALVRAEQLRIADMTAIDEALAGTGRTRGAGVLREVLRVYDARWEQTRSALELAFLDLVATHRLPDPEINAWLESRFLVDALWRERRVVVEVDGGTFHDTPSSRRDDARRDRVMRARGYTVLRFSHEAIVNRPGDVAAALHAELTGDFVRRAGTKSQGRA